MCDCKSENILFPAQKITNFKMWGGRTSNQNHQKTTPYPEYVYLGTI